jgi:dTDP-4-dehydrorhamnose 3,5-epimerase
MRFIRQTIPDVFLIEPKVHGDHRGYFVETYRQDRFLDETGKDIQFIQDNESKSQKGVLRGLHYQLPPHDQSKLVRVVEGEVLDVAVDVRVGSPYFGQHVAVLLSGENKRQLFVPSGFAHGFVVLSETAIFSYKVDKLYAPEYEHAIKWNDPQLGIDWPLTEPMLSDKDNQAPCLSNVTEDSLPGYY